MFNIICQCCGNEWISANIKQRYCPECSSILPTSKSGSYRKVFIIHLIKNKLQTSCAKCGKELKELFGKAEGKGRYAVHHKDENHNNNSIDNLELLCQSCHALHHLKGKPRSEEIKRKISAGSKGKTLSEEHINNMKKALTGRALSEDHKNNIRKGMEKHFLPK